MLMEKNITATGNTQVFFNDNVIPVDTSNVVVSVNNVSKTVNIVYDNGNTDHSDSTGSDYQTDGVLQMLI